MNTFLIKFITKQFFLLILFCNLFNTKGSNINKGIFKLPELIVETNSSYLIKGTETRLKCVIAGQPVQWKNVILDRVIWLKEGAPIIYNNESYILEKSPLSQVFNSILNIVQTSYHVEGEYQCSAILRNINILHEKFVDSRLVSAPLKLRRARITKFERYDASIVRVKQGQVARLACHGMPDVIPGPPEIWFEKYGHEGLALGRTGNERFIVTPSGLQIALTQPNDSGRYFCIVRNTYTNQTRKAPRPVVLIVDSNMYLNEFYPSQKNHKLQKQLQIVYPELINYSEPVEFHVVAGQTALLECVIWEAKVIWNSTNLKLPLISSTDNRARIRQIWGNLQIKHVTMNDSGNYVCYGISPLLLTSNLLSKNKETFFDKLTQMSLDNIPKVIYRLIVHAPTNVHLTLTQQKDKKLWQLNCYAHNLHYEIPMVYVNGLPLIDAIDELNVMPETNFFTNPINVTLQSKNLLFGSVQCISRPAMEEAEIYGSGLERGKAMNLYVDNFLSSQPSNNLTKTAIDYDKEVKKAKTNITLNETYLQILRPMAFIAEDYTVRLQWSFEPKNHLKLIKIQNFLIEILNYNKKLETETKNKWKTIEKVLPHLRAVTLKNILTDNEASKEFQLRIVANFIDGSRLISEPTIWLKIVKKFNLKNKNNIENNELNEYSNEELNDYQNDNLYNEENNKIKQILNAPYITRLQTVSHNSILVAWKCSFSQKINLKKNSDKNLIQKYIITYETIKNDFFSKDKLNEKNLFLESNFSYDKKTTNFNLTTKKSIEVDAKFMEMLLTNLEPDTKYKVFITVVLNNGQKSQPSKPQMAKTFSINNELLEKDIVWWTKLRRDYLNLPDVSLKFQIMFGALCIAALMLIILCFLTAFRLREWHRHRQQRGSSIDSNQYFLENSSPSFSSPNSAPYGLKKRDRQLYHEPCYFSIKDPISELSPLGLHDNAHLPNESSIVNKLSKESKPFNVNNNSEKCEYISRKALFAAFNENLNKNSDKTIISNTVKRPNLYGNSEKALNEITDEIYNSTKKNYPTYSYNQNKTNTLKRTSSLQRQRLNLNELNNVSEYNNKMLNLSCKLNNLNSGLRSPSPMEISVSSIYNNNGVSNFDYVGTNSHRFLYQQSTAQKLNKTEILTNTSTSNKLGKELILKDENNYITYLNQLNSKNDTSLIQNTQNDQLLNNQMVNIKNNNNNSLSSSKISLSNCGNSVVNSNDFQQSSKLTCYNFENFDSHNDFLTEYDIDQKLNTQIISSNFHNKNNIIIPSKQMSTFKSSSIPTSGSSGYNSYSGSGLTISGLNNYNMENKGMLDHISNFNSFQFCNKNLNNDQSFYNSVNNNLTNLSPKLSMLNQNCEVVDRNKQYQTISILTPIEKPTDLKENKILSFES